jgi:hypothetical protein
MTDLLGKLMALTPQERLEAMRRLDSGGGLHELLTNKWFVLLGWSVIFILLMILIAIRQQRSERRRREMIRCFERQADEFELTVEERDLLFLISRHARLRQPAMIFTLPNAFEKGVAGLLQKSLQDRRDEEAIRQMNSTIETIKVKIGFVKSTHVHGGRFRGGRNMTSRQIAVGKAVGIVPAASEEPGLPEAIEAEVMENTAEGLKLRLCAPVQLHPGDACILQVEVGAVLWGFEMVVLVSRGQTLELHHADQARYLNRRRFLRVPVHKPALVAPFPVVFDTSSMVPPRPVFTPAEIKELSGPVLRLQMKLQVAVRDRLLVLFELDPGRVIQDVGEVRRISESVTGRTVAVELIGLPESVEDELIRKTTQLALKMGLQENVKISEMTGEPVLAEER